MSARIGHGWLIAVLALCAAVLPSSASALTQRGHEYAKSFTIPAEAELLDPAGVAVNEASGDIYVADRGHDRVERFSAEGAFIAAWGWGVKGGEKYAVCAAGQKCIPGAKNKPVPEAFEAPESIAVDNSSGVGDPSKGDVYVANAKGRPTIDKFSATGEYLGTVLGKSEVQEIVHGEGGRIDGLAVDSHGVLWVALSGEGRIFQYSDAVQNARVAEPAVELSFEGKATLRPGFAVNIEDNFYVVDEPGEQEATRSPCEAIACTVLGLRYEENGRYEPEFGESFSEGLLGSSETGVTVDLTTDGVYVAHPGAVSAFDSHQGFIQNFGEGHLTRTGGLAVNGASQNVYVSDAATGALELYVPEGQASAAVPTIESLKASAITSSSAAVNAQVDPHGSETTVTFEYGTGSCAGGGCTAVGAAAIPAGHGEVERSAPIPGLAPGATYTLRVIAKNATGEASREETLTTRPVPLPDGRAWELVSPTDAKGANYEAQPNEGGIIQASEDGTALTYLSTAPTEAGTQGNRSPAFNQNLARRAVNPTTGKPEWSSLDISIPAPDRTPGAETFQEQEYFAFSQDLSLSLIQPFSAGQRAEPALSSPVTAGEEQEKTLYLRRNEGTCFPVPSSCYEALVTPANDHGEVEGKRSHFGGNGINPHSGLIFQAASPDAQHVAFTSGEGSSAAPLTAGVAAKGRNIYEWNRNEPESLKLVNLLPARPVGEEKPAERPAEGASVGGGELVRNSVSEDGSRVFFGTPAHHLYLRDTARSETLLMDKSAALTEEESEASGGQALYQGASADGKRVFFLDGQPLVAGSHAEYRHPDLFEWEQTSAEGEKLAGKLSDLTIPVEAESATVKGIVSAISKNGSAVYFVANGVLATNANAEGETADAHGDCGERAAATTCNLYVSRLEGGSWHTTFIAKLSGVDAPDFGVKDEGVHLSFLTAGDSPNGQYFAFMSKRPLIRGYDNRVLGAQAHGARAEEVYLYNGGNGRLVCASCEPDRSRPTAVADLEESGQGLGLLTDRSETWLYSSTNAIWLAGNLPGWSSVQAKGPSALQAPRYLSDSGRLFFNSAESLVPADENGKNDVYQYEPGGEGTCAVESGCVSLVSSGTSNEESAFLEASADGGDAFFLTASPLVPADKNGAYDVYDARVCTSGSPCVEAAGVAASSCESRPGCDGAPPTTAPAVSSAPTASTGPSGNLIPKLTVLHETTHKPPAKLTRAKLLAKALRSCKRYKKKSRRDSCERQARKRYGTKSKKHATRKKR